MKSITEKKIGRNLWLLWLKNEINATDREVTASTEQVQIIFHWKNKNINNTGYLRAFWDVEE